MTIGLLLFFHKDDMKLRTDIRGYSKAYYFKILKVWIEINHLLITSTKDVSKTMSGSILVMYFILLNTSI